MSLLLYLYCIGLIRTACGSPELDSLYRRLAELSSVRPASEVSPGISISNSSLDVGGPYKEVSINLLFARLQARLLTTVKAQQFFAKASVYGLPSYDNLLFRDNYILSYDSRLKHPNWVLENFAGRLDRPMGHYDYKNTFRSDLSLPETSRVRYRDYQHTGYDRGHMAPACDSLSSQEQIKEAFLMSNVAPQARNINGGGCAWTRLESYVLYLAHQSEDLHVISGTLYMPTGVEGKSEPESAMTYKVIGRRLIGVPTHFYKIILSRNDSGILAMEAFLVPNSDDVSRSARIEQFQISIDEDVPEIERLTGLKIFELVDKKNLVRSRMIRDFGSNSGI